MSASITQTTELINIYKTESKDGNTLSILGNITSTTALKFDANGTLHELDSPPTVIEIDNNLQNVWLKKQKSIMELMQLRI